MTYPEPTICVPLDPTNPGQFFACCGLFELADRLWHGAEGWFSDDTRTFNLAPLTSPAGTDGEQLIASLAKCDLTNTLSADQLRRRQKLAEKKKKELTKTDEDEKKYLDKLWREEPVVFHEPFNLRVDWFLDEWAGGDRYKTWAGQQSVIEIARALKKPIEDGAWRDLESADWLMEVGGEGIPFNFDSDLGRSADLDVGFSMDPLRMRTRTRALIELGAFIGLQRFRPQSDSLVNRHMYTAWTDPLLPEAAAVAATGHMSVKKWPTFEFQLLYRTKYLKSFLSAHSLGDNQ